MQEGTAKLQGLQDNILESRLLDYVRFCAADCSPGIKAEEMPGYVAPPKEAVVATTGAMPAGTPAGAVAAATPAAAGAAAADAASKSKAALDAAMADALKGLDFGLVQTGAAARVEKRRYAEVFPGI